MCEKMNACIALGFAGTCEEAFACYAQALGGTIEFMMRWADSAMADQAPPEWGQKIFHATLNVAGTRIVGGDPVPAKYEQLKGFSVILNIDDVGRAESVFKALAENGTVQTPLQETFWSQRFGALVDRFGVPWTINCEQAVKAGT